MPLLTGLKDYALPIAASLIVHGLVATVFLINWQPAHVKQIAPPRVMQAKLVELEARSKKKAASTKKTNVVDLTVQRQEQEAKKKQAAERDRAVAAKRLADQKAKKEKQLKEEREKRKEAERQQKLAAAEREKQQRADAFNDALEQEQGLLLEDEYETEAQSYIAAIARRIEDNWNRPPSARTGMQCELLIQLVPNGQVVNVELAKSSGNGAFDRSAVQAVKKVAQFPEIKEMPIEVFERHYRRLRLVFNPQDLRL